MGIGVAVIWLVCEQGWDDCLVHGAFTTVEKAEDAMVAIAGYKDTSAEDLSVVAVPLDEVVHFYDHHLTHLEITFGEVVRKRTDDAR